MYAFKILFPAMALCLLAMFSLVDANVLPATQNDVLTKRGSLPECKVCDRCDDQKNKDEQVQLQKKRWSKDIFSSFKADSINLNVTFSFSNGGGIRGENHMLIANKEEDDYTVFVHAQKVFLYGNDDGSPNTVKAFKVKGKQGCKADLLAGASVNSIYQVDALNKE